MTALVVFVTTAAALAAPSAPAAAADLPCSQLTRFDARNFPAVPVVDSKLLPLVPGTQRVYTGRSNVSGRDLPHQVTFTVTDLTKVIGGVRTVVVHDVDLNNGLLAEEELSFWAQDRFGNVWNIGEYPEEHLPNGIIRAPSVWMAGTSGAVPGIHMPAELPKPGGSFYLQGSVPKIDFLDCAETFLLNTASCVPVGCFTGVYISDETSPLDPTSGIQRKSYAPGIGIVDINFVDDPQGERLVLSQFNHLDEKALAPIRDAALAEDVRGLSSNADYARSPALERNAGPLAGPPSAATPTRPITTFIEPADVKLKHRVGRVELTLAPAGRRVGRAGAAAVRVVCGIPANRPVVHPGPCRGAVDLTLRGRRVGTARFSLRGGLARTLRIRLAPQALRALPTHVVAHTRDARAGGRQVTAARTLTLIR
jgi:hypothetical protein